MTTATITMGRAGSPPPDPPCRRASANAAFPPPLFAPLPTAVVVVDVSCAAPGGESAAAPGRDVVVVPFDVPLRPVRGAAEPPPATEVVEVGEAEGLAVPGEDPPPEPAVPPPPEPPPEPPEGTGVTPGHA